MVKLVFGLISFLSVSLSFRIEAPNLEANLREIQKVLRDQWSFTETKNKQKKNYE